MNRTAARCLLLACGNTLRGDDGVGPFLAEWAGRRFCDQADVLVIARQQWTPELAEEIANADSVLFIDCSVASAAGSLQVVPVEPSAPAQGLATHHTGAPELLDLTRELYASLPRCALMLTVGAGSIELGEAFSDPVQAALPEACRLLEATVLRLLNGLR